MEMPMPPDDQELRNVIDKLAQFVARNGPEFEKMTMEKRIKAINEHPPWAGPQHPDFGPPPHGFNGQPPHMRRQGPPHINHDDPSLVPIKGGDVRDKWDQYKGVGVALDDPYENYRRNKSYSFIARMKARDEFSTFGTRKEEKED